MKMGNLGRLGDRADLVGSVLTMIGLGVVIVFERTQIGALLVGIGLFGPSLLREAGVLHWRDDFHREVNMRAALHALLTVGVLLTAVMVSQGVGGTKEAGHAWELKDRTDATSILFPLAIVWGLSRLLQFWGPVAGAKRLVTAFFLVVAVAQVGALFIVWQRGSPQTPAKLLMSAAQILWIGALAMGVSRWPRLTGWLLLATVVGQVRHFARIAQQNSGEPAWIGLVYELCAWLPLLLAGLALVGMKRTTDEQAIPAVER